MAINEDEEAGRRQADYEYEEREKQVRELEALHTRIGKLENLVQRALGLTREQLDILLEKP